MSFGCTLVAAIEKGCKVKRETAIKMAEKIINAGAANGDAEIKYYWPQRFMGTDTEARDAAIRQEFNGQNVREICDRYGVSPRTVYRALHRAA